MTDIERRDMEATLKETIKSLSPRHQQVILLRYVESYTYRQIGETIHGVRSKKPINLERARQIHNIALRVLQRRLEKAGVDFKALALYD
jgi:DNA-directed RNA polymerase sigma subunit (sigma70/sigma32)